MDLPDSVALRARADQLLGGDVIWFPVRHHSPACAWHVRTLIETRRPFAVLVEGPSSFDPVLPHLVDVEASMPLAVYAYSVVAAASESGAHRAGFYYPLCDYSPELAALRAGAASGARLGFADLDHHQMAALAPGGGDHSLIDEHAYAWSAALAVLAGELGCRDHNELWDHLIEAAALDTRELVAAVAGYGALARFGEQVTDDVRTAAFDEAREAAMVRRVREELVVRAAAGSVAPIVVVAGAFHTAVLPELLADGSAAPAPDVPIPSESGYGVVRYSFERLDALSGYAAGMPSPGWYQSLWDAMQSAGAGPEAAEEAGRSVLRDVAALLRDRGGDGQPATPSVVDAHVHAELLRQLRGRRTVARDDVTDAVMSCYAKGEFGLDVRRELIDRLRGDRVGRLAPGTPRTPIAADFDRIAASLSLPLHSSAPRRLELAIHRDERAREVSRFLHSLAVLRVSFASALQLPHWGRTRVRDVTREIWHCQLTAETDPTLAEAALWGSSVREAAEVALRSQMDARLTERGGSAELMLVVRRALQCGLFDAVHPMLAEIRAAVATDPSLSDVAEALAEADLWWTGLRPLSGGSLSELPALGEQLYLRACSLVGGLVDLAADEAPRSVAALRTLHGAVLTADWLSLDDTLYWEAMAAIRSAPGRPRLAGAVDGLLWHAGRVESDELQLRAAGHLAAHDEDAGAEYLAGLVAVAREALWQVEGLLDSISGFLDGTDEVGFVRRLPQLRSVFALLAPRETDRVAEQLQRRFGGGIAPRIVGLSEAMLLANVAASAAVAEQLRGDGLESWLPAAPTGVEG